MACQAADLWIKIGETPCLMHDRYAHDLPKIRFAEGDAGVVCRHGHRPAGQAGDGVGVMGVNRFAGNDASSELQWPCRRHIFLTKARRSRAYYKCIY
jgi:hypothetical protein